MRIQRHAAWVAEQEAAAREMRLANIKLEIRAGVYETPARILGTVQKLKEVLMPRQWYANETAGGHQVLVYDERTGRDIALVYNKADSHLIAAAPAMLELLEWISKRWELEPKGAVFPCGAMREDALRLIAEAKGGARC